MQPYLDALHFYGNLAIWAWGYWFFFFKAVPWLFAAVFGKGSH